jgi:hypothetical protein
MLEGVTIKLCIIIEVVRVSKEVIARTEYITAANIWTWQSYLLWLIDFKAVFCLAIQRLSYLVA